jgi:hypothetical protein
MQVNELKIKINILFSFICFLYFIIKVIMYPNILTAKGIINKVILVLIYFWDIINTKKKIIIIDMIYNIIKNFRWKNLIASKIDDFFDYFYYGI